MADYAIGDIQGCYDPLQHLLNHIDFNERVDRLWFVGDLVNRGPQSLEVLRFIKGLPLAARITLGNHDLHLLASLFVGPLHQNRDDSLAAILAAPDGEELGHWLRQQNLLIHEPALDIAICHAGIAPAWDLDEAKAYALEVESALKGNSYLGYLSALYGNEPNQWSTDLAGMARLRLITNYFTRMRFCDNLGRLDLSYKGTLETAPANLIPWYAVPGRKIIRANLVFGHWAALQGRCPDPKIYAIDTGCLWGGRLTALRLQDRQRFSVPGIQT